MKGRALLIRDITVKTLSFAIFLNGA